MEKISILIVDDDQWVRTELEEFLVETGYQVYQAALPSEAFKLAEKHEPDIVILDIRLPEMDGLEVLARLKSSLPETEVIMITGHGDMNSVIHAMRSGASDYLPKPFRLAEVQAAVERTRKFIDLSRQLRESKRNYSLLSRKFQETDHRIIGNSPAMRSVVDLMSKVAATDNTTVLITGENGTGKELVARGIHYLSSRRNRHFYSVNLAAVSCTLFESELFGHKKGAFTGATENKRGWFEIAGGSTLFLDEICEIEPGLQTKLLRVLEERKLVRVGTHEEISFNVRVITATNSNIEQLLAENRFRKDLYHRINSFRIHIPPLRERKEDIPLLTDSFVRLYSEKMGKTIQEIDERTVSSLINYDFPGNIRELKNMVERAVILCEGSRLLPKHFPVSRTDMPEYPDPVMEPENFDMESSEKNLIIKALEKTDYNKSKAARLLNVSRQALDRRIRKFGLLAE